MAETKTRQTTEKVLFILLVVGAFIVLLPFMHWLLLAVWVAHLSRGLHQRVRRMLGGSGRGAAVIVIGLTLAILAPIVLSIVSISRDLVDLSKRLMESQGGRAALASLVSNGTGEHEVQLGPSQVVSLVGRHGDRAWQFVSMILGVATTAIIGFFLFLYGTYTLLVDGQRAFRWANSVLPFREEVIRRLANAFNETGRGLFVGVGVTGFIQAAAATVAYMILDIPRALVLGLLTFIASIIPSFGTALVWAPVAAGLALTGRPIAAVALALIGVLVIGTLDNFVRPFIANRANVHLPTFVVMVGMFGGLAAFGGWGILMGPLLLRLAMEAMLLAREDWLGAAAAPQP